MSRNPGNMQDMNYRQRPPFRGPNPNPNLASFHQNNPQNGGYPPQQMMNRFPPNSIPPRGPPLNFTSQPPPNFQQRPNFGGFNRGPPRPYGVRPNVVGNRIIPSRGPDVGFQRPQMGFQTANGGVGMQPGMVHARPGQPGIVQVPIPAGAGRARAKKAGTGRPFEEEDVLTIRPLGAGQEVGRSCILLDFKGKKILLDMGIHPAFSGLNSLPYLDHIDVDQVELLLISHFHLDHCGALPYFLTKTKFKGRTFMTHPTKAIYRWMLSDGLRVSQGQEQLFTEADIEKSMEKIETLDFHEEKEINGIRFWSYAAGHVLGAAMFMIEIAGVRVLYTGDFSRDEDRHLCAAEIPSVRADVVIMESTYGIHVHTDRESREHRFINQVRTVLMRGGKCLIPSFAIGPAQELLLIMDEYWDLHPEMQDFPIYYASALAKKCMSVYQTYTGAMNDKIKKKMAVHNPFSFKFVQSIRGREDFDDKDPCVVIATPGMMQSGLSRELFESWCGDPNNGCIIAGYVVEGTLGKTILSLPKEIMTTAGMKIPMRLSVEYVSFSAHTDFEQTKSFVKALKPPQIILVHGEGAEMNRLKMGLTREFEHTDYKFQIHMPKNTQSVILNFRGEKTVKVIGALAEKRPRDGEEFSGLLLKKSFTYTLADVKDIPNVTDLPRTELSHRVCIHYTGELGNVINLMQDICSEVELVSPTEASFFNCLRAKKEDTFLIIEWDASAVADMLSDALLGMLVHIQDAPPADPLPRTSWDDVLEKRRFYQAAVQLLTEVYGQECLKVDDGNRTIALDVKGKTADIVTDECKAVASDLGFRSSLYSYLARLYRSMFPVDFWCHTESGLVI